MKLICFLGLLAGVAANATPIVFQSSERQTSLLELYTSEGCSCPPAEAWLSGLKSESDLWSKFVPVAFHVDYWNNHTWSDKFSSGQYSSRQQDYGQIWSAKNIYTPEYVLNGKEWRNWFRLQGAPYAASALKTGVLQVSSDDGKHWQANFVPAENGTADYEINAALLVSETGSDIKGGENAGRHLNHDFAALSLITRPLARQTNGFQGGFIMGAIPGGITGRPALAAWVAHSGHLEPLQATGGWLPKPEKTNLSAYQPAQTQK